MCKIYEIFSEPWRKSLLFSDEEIIELFNHESYGTDIKQNNGFLVGKKWMDVNIKMWKEDIEKGYLLKRELYEDPKFPHWWLNKLFN